MVAEHDDAADEGDGGDGEEVGVGDHLAQVGRPQTQLLWCTAKKNGEKSSFLVKSHLKYPSMKTFAWKDRPRAE